MKNKNPSAEKVPPDLRFLANHLDATTKTYFWEKDSAGDVLEVIELHQFELIAELPREKYLRGTPIETLEMISENVLRTLEGGTLWRAIEQYEFVVVASHKILGLPDCGLFRRKR